MTISRLTYRSWRLVVSGLTHDLAVDFVTEGFKLVAIHENGVDTINFMLVFQEAKISHVPHDAGKDLQRHLVQLWRLQPQQGVLKVN